MALVSTAEPVAVPVAKTTQEGERVTVAGKKVGSFELKLENS